MKKTRNDKQSRKLKLARQTLRELSRDALANAGGGGDPGPSLDTCWSDCCS